MVDQGILPALIGDEYSVGLEQSATIAYKVAGFNEYRNAYAEVLAETPDFVQLPNGNRIFRNNIKLKRSAHDQWDATVAYGVKEDQGIDGFSIDFDISGATQKITQSLEVLQTYYLDGDTPVDYQGALGVTKDGIEGIEIVVPTLSWNQRFILPDSAVDDEYLAGLMDIVGHTNGGQFGAFGPGTVLQSGMSGSKKGKEQWDLSAKFAASKNVSGRTIGQITGINKGGWEYLEVHYADAADEAAKRLYRKPIQVDVHRVYDSADFARMKIPKS